MVMPRDIGAVDTMLGFPHRDMKEVYRFITRQTRDTQSKEEFDFPVEYMFKDVPEKALQDVDDPIAVTVREMDLWGIEKGLIGIGDPAGAGAEAMKRFPDRFIPSSGAIPMRVWRGSIASSASMRPLERGRSVCFPLAHSRKSQSTTRRCIPFMPSASNSAYQSSVVPVYRVRGLRHPANMWS